MTLAHDPELHRFKHTIDLLEYAKKAGFEPRRSDGGKGLTVLDHPNRDRIVVAKSPGGAWIYARVADYEPRAANESPEKAFERLRASIARSGDKGSIVEFVQRRDRTAGAGEVGVETVRERLREYRASGLPLDFEGPLRPPQDRDPRADRELNRRRYDWTPSPPVPAETDVEQRLRRWREAQLAIDRNLSRDLEVAGRESRSHPARAAERPATLPLSPKEHGLEPGGGRAEKNVLHQRRYDWTPPPEGAAAIPRAARGRGPERGR
jgi:hypothetical protein